MIVKQFLLADSVQSVFSCILREKFKKPGNFHFQWLFYSNCKYLLLVSSCQMHHWRSELHCCIIIKSLCWKSSLTFWFSKLVMKRSDFTPWNLLRLLQLNSRYRVNILFIQTDHLYTVSYFLLLYSQYNY